MTLFELVKVALDELYQEAVADHGKKADVEIKKQLTYLSSAYAALHNTKSAPIDYSDPATRFAYVFKYVASHGDYIVQVMESYSDKAGPLFSQNTTRISCIGGGPGSDVIAALKYLSIHKVEPAKKLICYLLDGEQAWADSWTEFSSSVDADVALTANFQRLDVSNPASWISQKKFLQADIFTMSYFLSEVYSQDGSGEVSSFFSRIFSEAKIGAVIIYIDNGHSVFNEFFDEMQVAHPEWQVVTTADDYRILPRFDEQASNLGVYLTKFGNSPKIQARVSSRTLRKVK